MAGGLAVNDNWQEAAALLPANWRSAELTVPRLVEARTARLVPLMDARASCGFPSPADDHLDKPLDFNELLITNRASIFVVQCIGDSMAPIIMPGDTIVIDRSRPLVDRAIILASLHQDFTIKRYRAKGGRAWLQPENPAYRPVFLDEDSGFQFEGVVCWTLRDHLLRDHR